MAQPRIDRATPSLIDPPTVRNTRVASVALIQPIDKLYSYHIPPDLESAVAPGMRLSVPFGRKDRPAPAFCISVSEAPWDSTLKPVLSTLDQRPILGPKLLELGCWIARYYAAPLGRTLDLMVPGAAKKHAGWRKVKHAILATDPKSRGLQPARPLEQPNGHKLSKKQQDVLTFLQEARGTAPIDACCQAASCGPGVIRTLESKGILNVETRLEPVDPEPHNVPLKEPDFELNADQQAAISQLAGAVTARRFSVQVLFGVTGSGKTECYIATIRRVLAEGRQAIMLVPEIALTTQTVRRFQARFEKIATVHSGLTGVARSRAWAAIATGAVPVVIGTRSAVFAPCPNLGVIIVDEEAESSFKNQQSPRYHTRDVAIKRAQLEGVPTVLGSATPSLETWHNVRHRRHYKLIRLPRRVRGLAMPTMHLVDMRDEHKTRPGIHLLSREMESHLAGVLDRQEQAVLLLNRRGFASFLHCPKCRTAITCPHCSVHMVFHATTELAHCHYCHARLVVPAGCQMAGCDGKLVRFGIGVQRVEAELRAKFPAARVRRVDSDIMQRVGDYADVLGAFERRECDILVGTQMIAKGLDFPFVSFVGVVSADTALALNDFRSEERTFQLVLQVSGRSGRGDAGGHVVVQTFAADTAPIRHAVENDYEGFAESELVKRRRAKLPPCVRMMRVILSDPRMTRLQKQADELTERIRTDLGRRGIQATVTDPAPAPIPRLRDQYRYDILLFFPAADAMTSAVDLFKSEGTLKVGVRNLIVDVDPVSLQ